MVRQHHRTAHERARGTSFLNRTTAARKKKPYKVVMEMITQEKKIPRSILTYAPNPPPNYAFVALGRPDLTTWCKNRCEELGLKAYIVSAKPKGGPNVRRPNADDQIDTQRIGHHFPIEVMDEAYTTLSYTDVNGETRRREPDYEDDVAQKLAKYFLSLNNHLKVLTDSGDRPENDMVHIRKAILEVFPKIPEVDLDNIVSHAFQKGTARVGNAKELPLARRVQLAVVAHIRHTYTNYDKHLREDGYSWQQARQKAQAKSNAKLREWRDEDYTETEEAFREVIVLDDEEDDTKSAVESFSDSDGREASLEIFSHPATARDLQVEDRPVAPGPIEGTPGRHPQSRAVYGEQPVAEQFRPDNLYPITSRPSMAPRSYELEPIARPLRYIRDQRSGQLYNLEPVDDARTIDRPTRGERLATVEYHPLPNSTARYGDGYAGSPRVHSMDNNPFRAASSSIVRRPPPREEDIVLPSIEREPSIIQSPGRGPERSFASQANHNPPSANCSSVTYPKLRSPKRKVYRPAEDVDDIRYDQSVKRMKPTSGEALYHGAVPGPRVGLEPVGVQARPQMPPARQTIDLTSSPSQPLPRHREVYPTLERPYPTRSGVTLAHPRTLLHSPTHFTHFTPASEYHTPERYELPIREHTRPGGAYPVPRAPVEYTSDGVRYAPRNLH